MTDASVTRSILTVTGGVRSYVDATIKGSIQNGGLNWGAGNAVQDTTLYRASAGLLVTNGVLGTEGVT